MIQVFDGDGDKQAPVCWAVYEPNADLCDGRRGNLYLCEWTRGEDGHSSVEDNERDQAMRFLTEAAALQFIADNLDQFEGFKVCPI